MTPKEFVENFDEVLEETECPKCSWTGMNSDGSFDWICPHCGERGSLPLGPTNLEEYEE